MQNNIDSNIILQILQAIKDILIGLFGGVVGYLIKYKSMKEKDPTHLFSFSMLFINIIIGGFTAYTFGSVINIDYKYRDFILGAVGVASYPIMLFIESKALTLILLKISKMFNIDMKDLK